MALPATFTAANGTELTAHDALWVTNTAHTGVMEIDTNRAKLRASPGASACYVYDQQPASADYDVIATFRLDSSAVGIGGIVGRADKTANTHYHARWNSGNLQLYKFVNGTATQLGSNVAQSASANTDYTLKLSMVGSTIKVFWNGVEKISQTDTSITATGYGGLRINSGDANVRLDNFDMTNMSAGASHATSGALAGGGAAVAGPATHIVVHATSGALAGGGAALAGLAEHSVPAGTHDTSGALAGAGGALAGSATHTAVHSASGAMAGGGAALAGSATHSVPGSGTITTEPLKNNTGTLLSNQTGAAAYVYDVSTGALVVAKTGQTTDGSGVMTITDAAIAPATEYRIVIVLTGGAEGLAKYTAS